jgi:hypothetical protein
MKVALVNTNRYLQPPVIPVGVEYLLAPLAGAGHDVSVCDLAFAEDPRGELISFLDAHGPDVIGFSVRNTDTVIYGSNKFFLDDAAALVETAGRHTGRPIVVGGSATACGREPLRRYLGADYLVAGPGEVAFPELLEALEAGATPSAVIDGWSRGIIPNVSHPRGVSFDYAPYLEGRNPAGIEFRKGCNWACSFCVERKTPILARTRDAVLSEAGDLAQTGAGMAFLCDCEVNTDLDTTNGFLAALAEKDLGLGWSGYFKLIPFDPLMARLASRAGFGSVTVWVNSWDLSSETAPYQASDVTRFLELCAAEGIKVAVDLLVGYPGESTSSIESAIDLLAALRPSTVGITRHIRLYEGLPVCDDAASAGARLLGQLEDNASRLKPVFCCSVDGDWLREKVSADPLFVMEGGTGTVNYQRI